MEKARQEWPWHVVIVLFVLVGLVLRFPGMQTDFWLDEIWTLFIVHHQVHSIADVFTNARVDNNHPLNTLLIYWMSDWSYWAVYRVPALLAGLGTIAMAMRFAARRGKPHAVAAGMLFAGSFPMVLYSTEARGYSLLIFFTLWAIDILDQYWIDHRARHCVAFAIAVILGCLANSTFILGYAAMFIWSFFELASATNWRRNLKRFACLHIVPILFISIYFVTFVFQLQIGGSQGTPAGEIAKQSLGFAIGLSNGLDGNMLIGAVGLIFSIVILAVVAKSSPKLLALFLPGVLLIPAVLLIGAAMRDATWLSPRHFLIAIVLFLLAASFAFGQLWNRRGIQKFLATLVLACLFASNLLQVFRFDHLGRGHYLDALNFILTHNADSQNLILASDYPNRTQMILDFYYRYLPPGTKIQYVLPADIARSRPRWYIGESDAGGVDRERGIAGLRYVPRSAYPCYGLSGASWTIFERVDE